MDIFTNVLVAIDFKSTSEQAKIDRVLEMAQQNENTALTLMYVAPEVTPDPETSIVSCKNQQQALINRGQEQLEALKKSFREQQQLKNKITCLVKVGKTSIVLTQQVLQEKHDLLVVNTQKKTLKESLFGSMTMDIMRSCPCPIWAVKPLPTTREKIMIGIDFDPSRKDQNAALNNQLLNLADMFRTTLTHEIHLINILDSVHATAEQIEENTTRLQQLAGVMIDSNIKTVVRVLEGDAKHALPKYAQQHSIALLVLGTREPTGLKRFFMGSTVETVLDAINCSVLTVKPHSFISRIGLK